MHCLSLHVTDFVLALYLRWSYEKIAFENEKNKSTKIKYRWKKDRTDTENNNNNNKQKLPAQKNKAHFNTMTPPLGILCLSLFFFLRPGSSSLVLCLADQEANKRGGNSSVWLWWLKTKPCHKLDQESITLLLYLSTNLSIYLSLFRGVTPLTTSWLHSFISTSLTTTWRGKWLPVGVSMIFGSEDR